MIQEVQHSAEHLSASGFLLILSLVLVVSKFFGEIAQRFRQSAVLGELVAGVVLGGSVLAVMPSAPSDSGYYTFHLVGELAVVVLLFEIGLETELRDMLKVGPASVLVGVIGVAVPFVLGFMFVQAIASYELIPMDGSNVFLVALTAGATLTATSVGITARVLSDINQLASKEAKIILGAAVIDDVIGLVILSVVSGLMQSGGAGGVSFVNVALVSAKAFGFLVAAVFIGNLLVARAFGFVDRLKTAGAIEVSALAVAFLYAYAGERIADVAPIVGAFAAGLVIRRSPFHRDVERRVRTISNFLVPVFFVAIGAQVDIGVLNPFGDGNLPVIAVALGLFVVAVFGKYVCAFGAFGSNVRKKIIGIGMIPRGEVGLIFAQVGYNNGKGVFDSGFFSAVVLMVMLTTFIVPPLLQNAFGGAVDRENTVS